MSTQIQLRGDSLRRQLEQSKKYAEAHGLELDESHQFHDIGVSAFTGENVEAGSLRRFLDHVRVGRIEPGSYLLVESLDRISRQGIMKALSTFMQVLESGINVVTLADGYVYNQESTNFQELLYSLMVLSRAHDESKTKSLRLSQAWNQKRKSTEFKLTAVCPAWMTLSESRRAFDLDQARVKIVKKIFDLSSKGLGSYTIARVLNESGVQPFGRSNGWQNSYIKKILSNRAVIGEYQPHRLIDGKRVPEGPPISGYYPAVISETEFSDVQLGIASRKFGGGGRKGRSFSNLFSGLVYCAYCGSKMHFINKGPRPKGGTYLVCDAGRRGLKCEVAGWRYDHLELSILKFVNEIDLNQILRDDSNDQRLRDLRMKLVEQRAALKEHQVAHEQLLSLLGDPKLDMNMLRTKLAKVEDALSVTNSEIASLQQQRNQLVGQSRDRLEIKSNIDRFIGRTAILSDDDAYVLRSQLSARIRSLVSKIELAVSGHGPFVEKSFSEMSEAERASLSSEEMEFYRNPRLVLRKRNLYLQFHDGGSRDILIDPSEPSKFTVQTHRHPDAKIEFLRWKEFGEI